MCCIRYNLILRYRHTIYYSFILPLFSILLDVLVSSKQQHVLKNHWPGLCIHTRATAAGSDLSVRVRRIRAKATRQNQFFSCDAPEKDYRCAHSSSYIRYNGRTTGAEMQTAVAAATLSRLVFHESSSSADISAFLFPGKRKITGRERYSGRYYCVDE